MNAPKVEAIDALRDVVRIAKAASIGITRNEKERIPRAEYAIACVASLLAADYVYDEARRKWDIATGSAPDSLSHEAWRSVATRFEEACMQRLAAMDRCTNAPNTTAAAATAAPSTTD